MTLMEFLARCIAARRLRLVKDPNGVRLPEELWAQALPEAEFVVGALEAFELRRVVLRYHEAEEGE